MAGKSERDGAGGAHEAPSTGDSSKKPTSHRAPREDSRRERSEALSLIIEFFRMSRTTAIILVAFVLISALYMFVRQDPVVAFNSPPRSDSSQTDTTGTDTSGTDEPTPSDQPTDSTDPSGTQTPTDTSGTETSVPVGQRGADQGGQDGDQSPQGSESSPTIGGSTVQQQGPQQQAPRQQAPPPPVQSQVPVP